jgi:hypothetical protein
MLRNKTRKSSSEGATPVVTATAPPHVEEVTAPTAATNTNTQVQECFGENPNLVSFLDTNAGDAFRRPWHRLERGLRLNRIRLFIASEKTKLNLSDLDTDYLTNLLHKSLDKKLLNSKSAVVYNIEAQEIQEIKGLVYHTTSEGRVLSQIVEKKGVTFRKPHH